MLNNIDNEMACMRVRKIRVRGLPFRVLFARKRRVVTGGASTTASPTSSSTTPRPSGAGTSPSSPPSPRRPSSSSSCPPSTPSPASSSPPSPSSSPSSPPAPSSGWRRRATSPPPSPWPASSPTSPSPPAAPPASSPSTSTPSKSASTSATTSSPASRPGSPSSRAASAADLAVAFPDDGAWKRFHKQLRHFPAVVCAKVRQGDARIVRLKEGSPAGRHVVIVDDLVQSGGTLIECMKVLFAHGAAKVSAYVTHGVFPKRSWERFLLTPQRPSGGDGEGGDGEGGREEEQRCFTYFWITDSCPLTVQAIEGKAPFEVLSLAASIADALQI